MNRTVSIGLIGCLSVWLGMAGGDCDAGVNLALLPGRAAPAIIATAPGSGSAQRTFEVDLRRYPDAASIAWEFGDGGKMASLSVSGGRVVSHTYGSNGTFDVKVHLFSAPNVVDAEPARLLATGSLPVDVLGPNVAPVPAFSIEDLPTSDETPGIGKRFIASGSRDPDGSIVEFRWDFGDGGQAIGQTVDHFYTAAGLYTVRLSVKDDRDERRFIERTIFVNGVPEARFRFEIDEDDTLLVRFSGSRSNDPDGEIVRYDWDFGDGDTLIDGGVSVQHRYDAPGTFTVRLDVFDDQGVTDFVNVAVTVTSTDPFVTSVDERYGEVDTETDEIGIEGLNFNDGATVRLERGGQTINAATVLFKSTTSLGATFDLNGATLGDYDIVVVNPDTMAARLDEAFRVVTPDRVRLVTSLGDVVISLVSDAPITTANYLQYVEDQFYDGTIFHRVVPDFVVQGGGFLPGMVQPDGLRDPIQNEFSPSRSNLRGTVAMAKVGGNPDSATSQFFFNLKDNSGNLDNQNGGFTVFANVVEGLSVVDAIAAVPLDGEVPVDDVLLIRAERE